MKMCSTSIWSFDLNLCGFTMVYDGPEKKQVNDVALATSIGLNMISMALGRNDLENKCGHAQSKVRGRGIIIFFITNSKSHSLFIRKVLMHLKHSSWKQPRHKQGFVMIT